MDALRILIVDDEEELVCGGWDVEDNVEGDDGDDDNEDDEEDNQSDVTDEEMATIVPFTLDPGDVSAAPSLSLFCAAS